MNLKVGGFFIEVADLLSEFREHPQSGGRGERTLDRIVDAEGTGTEFVKPGSFDDNGQQLDSRLVLREADREVNLVDDSIQDDQSDQHGAGGATEDIVGL